MLSDVVSVDKALNVCGDMGFLLELVNDFLEDLGECKQLLGVAHVEKDILSVKNLSHRIKGQALTLSCKDLSDKSSRLEDSAGRGTYTDAEYDDLLTSIDHFVKCVESK